MPPHKASQIKWSGNRVFGTDTLKAKPEMAILVLSVIAGWSVVETHLGRIFAVLIGAKQPVTLAMYTAVRSFSVQRDLLQVAAKEVLAPRYSTLFIAAMSVLERAAKDRHAFAHGVWGMSADPDLNALILLQPKHFWNLDAARLNYRRKSKDRYTNPTGFLFGGPQLELENILVYRLKDLQEVSDRIERAFRIAETLQLLVTADSAQRRQIYKWLCGEADIKLALDREVKAQPRKKVTDQTRKRKK